MSEEKNRPPKKTNPYIFGIILVVAGLLLIIGRYLDFGGIQKLWPLFLFIPVIPLVRSLIKSPRENANSLIPVTILVIYGLYFFWLNYGGWDNASYTWPNFVLAPGLGFLAAYLVSRDRGLLIPGGILCLIGLVMYGRIIINRFGMEIDRLLLSGIVLIVVGLAVIFSRRKQSGKN